MTGSDLAVRLLGRESVSRGGVALAGFRAGPLLRLLSALVLRPGVPVSRTELAFRLWPDSSEAQARTNLRKALHVLRQELDDVDRFVEITHGSARWLADGPAEVDAVAFLAACDDGDDRTAAALYGGPLLPGVYDDWVLEERARLHGLAVGALRRLVECAGDESAERLTFGLRLVELDPASEWAHRGVIEAHAERGDRAAAIRAYHRCVELLATEVGVEPTAETQALYERLVQDAIPHPGPRRRTSHGERLDDVPAGVLLPSGVPLIGRDRELAALAHRWSHLGTEPLHLVVVTGEAGVGKSRLIAEFARRVRAEGSLVMSARSYEAVDAPWGPVAAWLRTDELQSVFADAPAELLSEASRLAPELRARADVPAPSPVSDELARFQFAEALVTALLSGTAPRLMVLDDMQWCDSPTLGLVAHLLHTRPTARAMVIASAAAAGATSTATRPGRRSTAAGFLGGSTCGRWPRRSPRSRRARRSGRPIHPRRSPPDWPPMPSRR